MSGNAHPELAEAVAAELNVRLVDAVVDRFPDDETRVEIYDNVREQDVFVLQPTGPPANENLMESLIIIDALQRASAGRITAVTPYFGYARQDRKDASRVPITAKLVVNQFESAGADRLLAIDLHSAQIQGFTDKPFDHLYARNTILETLRREVVTETDQLPVIAAPDVGAAKMVRSYARRLGTQLAIVVKEREDALTTTVEGIIGAKVVGRNVVIVDDMVTTGGSLLRAAEALKGEGAEQVMAAVTHGVLCGDAIENIDASPYLDRLYVTDTLPRRGNSDKIRRITIAPLLARAIRNVHNGESVSGLF